MTLRPKIYLDHAATSWPKPESVLRSFVDYHHQVAGSPGRGSHSGAVEATKRVERVRRELSDFFGLADQRKLLFTPSCTQAIQLAIFGTLRKGDHAIATVVDHNAVLRPLAAMQQKAGIDFSIAPADRDGFVDPAAVAERIRDTTKLIIINHASNVLGTIQNIGAMIDLARKKNIYILVDAAQTAGAIPIDMQRLGMDMLAIPSHKGLLGPSGAGALLVGENVVLEPQQFGGNGLDSQSLSPNIEFPVSFETGTGNPAGIVALGEGLRHVAGIGVESILAHERKMILQLEEMLLGNSKIQLFGPRDITKRVGVLALSIHGLGAHEVSSILDASFGIAVRAGISCAPFITKTAGGPDSGFVRISVGGSTTSEDIAAAADALLQIAASTP